MPRKKKEESNGSNEEPSTGVKKTRRTTKKAEGETAAKASAPRAKRKAPEAEMQSVGFTFRTVGAQAPAPVQRKPTRQKRERKPPRAKKPTAEVAPPARAKLPEKPQREPIPIPDDAPRVVIRHGRPVLAIDGRIVPPFMFFGNPSNEARARTVFEEIRKAAQAGIHLHSLMVEFPVSEEGAQEALDLSDYLLHEALAADPEGHIMFRLVFAGAPGWEKKYPKAVFHYADGSLAEPSFSDKDFWNQAAKLLAGYIKGLLSTENARRVLGLHLDRGEWFFANGWGYDTSAAAEEAFRSWATVRYNGDRVALQSAWFEGNARFDNLRVPEYNEEPLSGEGFLRARRKERRWVDYHLFLSDTIVERIQDLSYEVKKASGGRLLVAASYGYTFEWAHPASGHLSLGKLLRTREVDIIAGPPSYKDRKLGGAAAFPGPIDSFALNGKLFISEEDFKTPISKVDEPDAFNPAMPTPQALEAAHWRGVGSALVHGTGICWMDLWGNGWLNTTAIWQRAARVRDTLIRALASPERDPDVAVLIDERSLAYLSDSRAFKQLVQDSREAILRAGVSAGFYLLSDLAHRKRFPEAKLYIFLNAWDIRPEVRAAIKSRLQRDGKTLFWVYSAGLFESGRPALERVREATGIAIRPQPFNSRAGTTILNRRHPVTELLEERALSVVDQLEPSYFAIPEEGCTILGEYTQTGLPSFVVREVSVDESPNGEWRSVFLGEPLITEKLIRGLCALAGVQIWNYHGDVVHVRPPYLAIHYSGTGHRIATLPERWHAFDAINDKMISADATHLRSEATDGNSQVLFVGEEDEVQELSSLDTEPLLEIGEIEEAEDDTISQEEHDLDVPIMTLALPEGFEESFEPDAHVEEEPAPRRRPAKRKAPSKKRAPAKRTPKKAQSKTEEGLGFVFRNKE